MPDKESRGVRGCKLAWLLIWLMTGPACASPLLQWIRDGNYRQALGWIDQQLQRPGDHSELLLLKVRCLFASDQNQAARQLLQRIPAKPSPLYFLLKGLDHQEFNEVDQARVDYGQALKCSGESAYRAEAASALASLDATRDWGKAQEFWNEGVELASQPGAGADWGRLYFARIQMLRRHGDLEEALTTSRLARQACPNRSLEFRMEEAQTLISLGRYQDADELYLRLAGERSSRPRFWLVSGIQMALGKGRGRRMTAARRWFQLSQQVDTQGWMAYDRFYFILLRGYIQFADNQPAQALRLLHQAELVLGDQAALPPGGNGVRISLAFHQLSPEGQSELGLCCWASAATMMEAHYPDETIDRFMEQRSARLPAAERMAWLVVLGNNYRKKLDPRCWERYQEALNLAEGDQRQLLLISLLQKRFPSTPPLSDLNPQALDGLLETAAGERLSPEGLLLGPFAELESAVRSALDSAPALEEGYREREKDSRQSRSESSIVSSSLKLAYLQILRNRPVEAQASMLRAWQRESSQFAGWRLREQLATLQVLAGRAQVGLDEIEDLRRERESAEGRKDAYWALVLRQAILAVRAGDSEQALQLVALGREHLDPFRQGLMDVVSLRAGRGQPPEDPLKLFASVPPSVPGGASLEWLSSQEFLARLSQIRLRYPEFETAVAALPPQFLELGQKLAPDTLLVEYFVAPFETFQLLSYRGQFALRRLEVDRELLGGWVSQLRAQVSGRPVPVTASRILYDLLIPELPEHPRLVIIPQGPLYDLPWDLLVDRQERFLGEGVDFRFWAAEATDSRPWVRPSRLLGLGDVKGANLPGSRVEVMKLAEVFPDTELLLEDQANSARLREQLSQCDVVHLATHAHLDPPSIQLSDGDFGLEQIYRLPLKPGCLVVLSQCGSGDAGGQSRSPLHLASGFLAAGASRVVATLTPVGDEEVSQFMGCFYGHLGRGLTPDQALRQSKLDCSKSAPHGDWASFVLISGL